MKNKEPGENKVVLKAPSLGKHSECGAKELVTLYVPISC